MKVHSVSMRALMCGMAVLMASPAIAAADGNVDTDLDVVAGYWSRDMRLPKSSGVAVTSLGAGASWTPESAFSAETEVFAIASRTEDGNRSRLEIRKGFFTLAGDKVTVRVGRQVDVWGRADRINPTDNLSARDYTTLSANDDNQRLGIGMARADIALSDTAQLSAYWVPEFRANKLLINPPSALPQDDRDWDAGQFALKFDNTGGAVDWSVSYYQGRDRIYDFAVQDNALSVQYNEIRSFGADMATSVGQFGLRAEAAYVDTDYDSVTNPLVRRPEIWAVAGIDRSFGANTYVNFQTSLRNVMDYDEPVPSAFGTVRNQVDTLRFQQDETQVGVTANLRQSWDDRRWTAEVVALHYFQRNQGLFRAELRHQLNSTLTLVARAQNFYGDSGTYFDRVSPASSFTLELRAAIW